MGEERRFVNFADADRAVLYARVKRASYDPEIAQLTPSKEKKGKEARYQRKQATLIRVRARGASLDNREAERKRVRRSDNSRRERRGRTSRTKKSRKRTAALRHCGSVKETAYAFSARRQSRGWRLLDAVREPDKRTITRRQPRGRQGTMR